MTKESTRSSDLFIRYPSVGTRIAGDLSVLDSPEEHKRESREPRGECRKLVRRAVNFALVGYGVASVSPSAARQ